MNDLSADSRWARACELLRGFPPGTLEAAEEYFRAPAAAPLDRLIDGVLLHHLPARPTGAPPAGPRTDATLLVEELNFDSLAMVEMGFLLEDLLGVRLGDEELRTLRTLGDLRGAVRRHCGLG